MIEVTNLTKRYGPNLAVDHISFTIEKGHVYGFLGPNGAGKSTTMNILTGCLAASEGQVSIDGHDIFEDAVEAKRCIGYLPELPPLYGEMTPREYLSFVARAKRIPRRELREAVGGVMEKTQITGVADRLIRNLSKGFRQRVGIAQAILGNPEVVILDEPTVGLDPQQIMEIRELIRELGREHTVVLSSHILQEISAVCERVIIISRGRIVAADSIRNLTQQGGGQVLRLDSRGDAQAIRRVLTALQGVLSVEVTEQDGYVHAEVSVPRETDLREQIFRAYAELDMPLVGMSSGERTLEEVFLQLTEESAHAGNPEHDGESKRGVKAFVSAYDVDADADVAATGDDESDAPGTGDGQECAGESMTGSPADRNGTEGGEQP